MPYRPEAELKRPDLKGEFLCGHCGKTFCHAASLNRHRLNFHGDDQQCLICQKQIPHNDTIRRHMATEHNIQRVFTCGCCNWTFPDKKELHAHNNSMMKTGLPGEAAAIAVSSRKPGSLSQHELRGEERTPRTKKRSSKGNSPLGALQPGQNGDQLMAMLANIMSAQNQPKPEETPSEPVETKPSVPTSWIQQLLTVNPALFPFFPMQSPSASSTASSSETEVSKTPEPTFDALSLMMNNNVGEASTSVCDGGVSGAEEENIDVADDGKDDLMKAVGANFLSVNTERPVSNSLSSGPESGIGSAPISNTPSPTSSSSTNAAEMSPPPSASDFLLSMVQKAKRRSIDDICFNLVVKKTCT
uniref:C2H2-type domain-containing protein n=1 Tax=Caenorhabditis tropicalis TaxID=1561998 RepID=A0A1I7T3A9_9PELO